MSFLLFCIAQIPSATIDALLQAPRHKFLSLVLGPTQSSFDPICTVPPVQPFETRFLDFDREKIRSFIAQRVLDPVSGTFLDPDRYTLLDERSIEDHTVVFGIARSSLHDRDPDAMTEDGLEQWWEECEENPDAVPDMWREFRVVFDQAEQLCTALTMESDFTQKLYDDEFVAAHTDAQGVFLVEAAKHAFAHAQETADEAEDDDAE